MKLMREPAVKGRQGIRRNADVFLHRHFSGDTLDYKQILAIFVPILADQAFLTLMSFLNTAMISTSGEAAVSAVNMIDSINNFLVSVLIAVSTGGTVVVAQYKGKGDLSRISKSIGATIMTVFFLAALMTTALLLFAGPILGLLFPGAEPKVLENASVYLMGSAISYCGIAVMEAVCCALRGIGETRSSLALSVIMHGSYVLLNLVFINGAGMGIVGMSLSLNIARYLAAACAILLVLKRRNPIFSRVRELVHLDFALIKRVMQIGLPFASEQLFFNGGKILTQTFIVQMGLAAQAVNAICTPLVSLANIVPNALVLVTVTVVGQSIGRRDLAQARKVLRSFLVTVTVVGVFVGGGTLLFFDSLVSLFSPSADIVGEIFMVTAVTCVGQVLLWGLSFLPPAALRAGGDARFTSVVSMLSMWLFRVVLGYFLGVVLGYGVLGVWLAMVFEWGIRGAVFMLRFRGDKWYRHKVID